MSYANHYACMPLDRDVFDLWCANLNISCIDQMWDRHNDSSKLNDEDEDVNIVVEESDGGVYSDEDDDVSEEVDVVMGGESANALTAMRK